MALETCIHEKYYSIYLREYKLPDGEVVKIGR